MAEMQPMTILVVILIVVFLVLIFSKCNKSNYTRTCLSDSTNCLGGPLRTPVDYMSLPRANPHFVANPWDRRQPLEQGPVDFWPDLRKLENGTLFDQYGNYGMGCGNGQPFYPNDTKTRSLVVELGDLNIRRMMDNEQGPEYGPKGPICTDLTRIESMPCQ